MQNPNKQIRKAIYDAVNPTIPTFDTRVSGSVSNGQYMIMSTQSKEIDKSTKCGYRWVAEILLDIVCIYNGAGNTGSRVAVDDMENNILGLIENITISGFTIVNTDYSFPNNLDNQNINQMVYRNFIRITYYLQEQ